jgi:hypothetical protein
MSTVFTSYEYTVKISLIAIYLTYVTNHVYFVQNPIQFAGKIEVLTPPHKRFNQMQMVRVNLQVAMRLDAHYLLF